MLDFDPQGLANMSWSVAVLGVEDTPLMNAISSAALRSMHHFSATDLANTAWAVAKLCYSDSSLLDSIAAQAIPKIGVFRHRELSNTAWAFAIRSFPNRPLLNAISSASLSTIRFFSDQELANTVWAFANLECSNPPLMAAIAAAALPKMRAFSEQGLSTTAWALATLLYFDAPLLDAIAAAARQKRREFRSQGLANNAWAFATLGVQNAPLRAAISAEAIRKISDFSHEELASTAWAFASLKFNDVPLLTAIAAEAIAMLESSRRDWEGPGDAADATLIGRRRQARTGSLGLPEALGLVHALAEAEHPSLEELLGSTLAALRRRAGMLDGARGSEELDLGSGAAGAGDAQEPHCIVVRSDLCVLWKPSGWTVRAVFGDDSEKQGSRGRGGGPELQDWVAERLGARHSIARDALAQHGLLHRLDRETSGAVLWARSYLGYYIARVQFAARRLRKGYVCLCNGLVQPKPRVLDMPLLETAPADSPPRTLVASRGRAARTEVVNVGHFLGPAGAALSVVELLLHTGRQHQIRAHLGYEGHPLVGDALYGGGAPPWCPRFLLHAGRLRVHIGEGADLIDSQAPLPTELQRLLVQLIPADARAGGLLPRLLND